MVIPGGQTRPCSLAAVPEATNAPSLPRRLQHLASLPHGEVVCAVTIGLAPLGRGALPSTPPLISTKCEDETGEDGERHGDADHHRPPRPSSNNNNNHSNNSTSVPHFAYTGGRGCVKLWDLDAISSSQSSSPRDVVALTSFDCLRPDSYVRSIKLFPVSALRIFVLLTLGYVESMLLA